jgi:hypothetical protein
MGMVIKFLVFALLLYLVWRRLAAWLREPERPRPARPSASPPPYDGRNVIEAKFTEVRDEGGEERETRS